MSTSTSFPFPSHSPPRIVRIVPLNGTTLCLFLFTVGALTMLCCGILAIIQASRGYPPCPDAYLEAITKATAMATEQLNHGMSVNPKHNLVMINDLIQTRDQQKIAILPILDDTHPLPHHTTSVPPHPIPNTSHDTTTPTPTATTSTGTCSMDTDPSTSSPIIDTLQPDPSAVIAAVSIAQEDAEQAQLAKQQQINQQHENYTPPATTHTSTNALSPETDPSPSTPTPPVSNGRINITAAALALAVCGSLDTHTAPIPLHDTTSSMLQMIWAFSIPVGVMVSCIYQHRRWKHIKHTCTCSNTTWISAYTYPREPSPDETTRWVSSQTITHEPSTTMSIRPSPPTSPSSQSTCPVCSDRPHAHVMCVTWSLRLHFYHVHAIQKIPTTTTTSTVDQQIVSDQEMNPQPSWMSRYRISCTNTAHIWLCFWVCLIIPCIAASVSYGLSHWLGGAQPFSYLFLGTIADRLYLPEFGVHWYAGAVVGVGWAYQFLVGWIWDVAPPGNADWGNGLSFHGCGWLLLALLEECGWAGLVYPTIWQYLKKYPFFQHESHIHEYGTIVKGIRVSRIIANIICGILWSSWHWPFIFFGGGLNWIPCTAHYYPGTRATPLIYSWIMFTLQTIFLRMVMTRLTLICRSLWPALILHATHNAQVYSFFAQVLCTPPEPPGSGANAIDYMIGESSVWIVSLYMLMAICAETIPYTPYQHKHRSISTSHIPPPPQQEEFPLLRRTSSMDQLDVPFTEMISPPPQPVEIQS